MDDDASQLHRIASHEAAHATVANALGYDVAVDIVRRGDYSLGATSLLVVHVPPKDLMLIILAGVVFEKQRGEADGLEKAHQDLIIASDAMEQLDVKAGTSEGDAMFAASAREAQLLLEARTVRQETIRDALLTHTVVTARAAGAIETPASAEAREKAIAEIVERAKSGGERYTISQAEPPADSLGTLLI
jgi:hypothetical protein